MITHTLHEDTGVLEVCPQDKLEVSDFESLALVADKHIQKHGKLNGLLIYTENFPGWEDFGAFTAHMKFVNEHHKQIEKVAAVTDSGFLTIMPKIANHFIKADVQHFDYEKKDEALNWLCQ